MSVAAALMTVGIRTRDIDPLLAREGAADHEGNFAAAALRDLLHNTRVRILLVAVILFHLANGACFHWLANYFSVNHPDTAQTYLSACILISQLVMLPIAVVAGRLADGWGRKPTLLVGFALLPIRGLLFTTVRNPYALVSIQIPDGVSVGIFGVVAVVMIADLARRTGRFNLMQGAMNTCVVIGASLSNLVAGFVAREAGFRTGFMMLTALAVGALAFFWAVMPETQRRIRRCAVWPFLIDAGKWLASLMAG